MSWLRRLFLAASLALVPAWAGAASPTVDGSCTATDGTGTTTTSCSLTTTLTNDIIVAAGWFANLSTTPPTVSSVTGGGLTWSLRATQSHDFGANCAGASQCAGVLAIYTAPSASALVAQSLTFNHSSTSAFGGIVIFGANGVFSTAAPFDGNGALPGSNSNTSGSTNTPTVGITTSNANDLLLAFIGSYNIATVACTGSNAPPAGWTIIAGATLGTSCVDVGYLSVSTPQAMTASWSNLIAINAWSTFGDALTGDSGPPSTTSFMHQVPWMMGH